MDHKGHFINGKAHAISLLKALEGEERNRLLAKMYQRNPQLTEELGREGQSFHQLASLEDPQLKKLFSGIDPQITGLALKDSTKKFQKKVLKVLPRAMAIKAFEIITSNPPAEAIKRAQEKIMALTYRQ